MVDGMAAPDAEAKASYSRILTSTSVVGGASIVVILIGVARTKGLAVLVGPAGIGYIGLLTALLTAASTVAQMGMASVGTRQIAEANGSGDSRRVLVARRALVFATMALAGAGALVVFLLRDWLGVAVLKNPDLANDVAWIAVGVGLSVAAVAQTALIQGMRRIGDLALLRIGGALVTTAIGLPMIWRFGAVAIPFYVVLVPLTSFLLGLWFVSRLPRFPAAAVTLADLRPQWRMFFVLGLPIMGAAVASTLAALWIAADVKAALGVETLGYYVAANTIASQYVGLVLAAMAADYYPRLAGVITDAAAARRLVGQQTEIALLLAGPLIIAMFALAPWVIRLLYADAFAPASEVLRWMAAGTVLKVLSWPLGFTLLAAGAGRAYFVKEVAVLLVMAAGTSVLVRSVGLAGAGIAYFVAFAINLPLLIWLARRHVGSVRSPLILAGAGLVAGACAVVAMLLAVAPEAAMPTGAVLAAAFGAFSFVRLHRLGVVEPIFARIGLPYPAGRAGRQAS